MCIKEVRKTCIGFVQRHTTSFFQGSVYGGRGGLPQCLKPFLSISNNTQNPAPTMTISNKGQYAKSAPTMTIFAVFATIWWMNLH